VLDLSVSILHRTFSPSAVWLSVVAAFFPRVLLLSPSPLKEGRHWYSSPLPSFFFYFSLAALVFFSCLLLFSFIVHVVLPPFQPFLLVGVVFSLSPVGLPFPGYARWTQLFCTPLFQRLFFSVAPRRYLIRYSLSEGSILPLSPGSPIM